MRERFVGVNDEGVSLFDRGGQVRADFTQGFASINSPATDLGPENPGRISSGDYQINPLGHLLPSNIVTPLATWRQVPPEMNIAVSMILMLSLALATIDTEEGRQKNRFTPSNIHSFQIVDFNDFLPESAAEGV